MIPFRNFLGFLLLIALSACDSNRVYDQYMSTGDGMWSWKEVGVFEPEIKDTLSLNNIYLQIRHTVDYPMSNLYMFVVLKGPSGQFMRDTVNLILAAPDGRWIGKGTGKLRELQLLYRKQIRFSEPGTYHISIEQGMRSAELPVTDVGVRIERINPSQIGEE
jgi:gliding motility-associated lipoprotein GldH